MLTQARHVLTENIDFFPLAWDVKIKKFPSCWKWENCLWGPCTSYWCPSDSDACSCCFSLWLSDFLFILSVFTFCNTKCIGKTFLLMNEVHILHMWKYDRAWRMLTTTPPPPIKKNPASGEGWDVKITQLWNLPGKQQSVKVVWSMNPLQWLLFGDALFSWFQTCSCFGCFPCLCPKAVSSN